MANDVTTGSKYAATKGLGMAAISKLIRADIKAILPQGFKCSVRSETYSLGRSVRVSVTAVPAGFEYWTEEFLASNPHRFFEGQRLTAEARVVLRALERVCAAYNEDRSDLSSDYYNVSFHASVDFAFEITKADRDARKPGAVAA